MRNRRFQRETSLRDFEIGKNVGKGRFGNVNVARHLQSGRIVVLKRLDKREIVEEKLIDQVKREIEIHYRLNHRNIIKLYCYFHDDEYVYLVQEFASKGELYKHLQKAGRFTERKVSSYIRQITLALSFMHRHGILHRDIKPENILVMEDGTLRLADFGYVVRIDSRKCRRSTRCGTLDYFSPEMVNGYKYDQSVDIWALGVLTYELLVGKAPFYEKKETETLRRIQKGRLKFPSYVSEDAKNFIRKLLRTEDYKRMTASEALKHKFMTKYL